MNESGDTGRGVLVPVLRDLRQWLEYGDFDHPGVDDMKFSAWINALAAAIHSLEEPRG